YNYKNNTLLECILGSLKSGLNAAAAKHLCYSLSLSNTEYTGINAAAKHLHQYNILIESLVPFIDEWAKDTHKHLHFGQDRRDYFSFFLRKMHRIFMMIISDYRKLEAAAVGKYG
ncbi:hypothetical protein ACJX0J_040207, partial [Zea mays]